MKNMTLKIKRVKIFLCKGSKTWVQQQWSSKKLLRKKTLVLSISAKYWTNNKLLLFQ